MAGTSGRIDADSRQRSIAALASLSETELVDACLAGRREAFDVIVERHRRSVYQLCYRFVGNHEDASDLSQDVFVRAYRGLKNFKRQSSIGTWLYRIGVNVCLNRVTAKTPLLEPIEPERHPDEGAADPMQSLVQSEQAARVRAAIRRLPRKQRTTLILRVYHELPHEEIARILGSSVGAVKANFFHALGNLKRLLQSEEC
ncbi:MAG: RNA polymerase sigma factor [Acidobacteria bacterium]|nr:RNA polymerase sigma factor [Acidobacteriota bacterium]